jgi:hypothetical protein
MQKCGPDTRKRNDQVIVGWLFLNYYDDTSSVKIGSIMTEGRLKKDAELYGMYSTYSSTKLV